MNLRGIGILDPVCPVDFSQPLNRGLVGWWLVPPNSGWRGGLTLRDLVRGGRLPNDGTLTNGPAWVGARGRPGGCGSLSFDGSDDYVDCGAATNLANLGPATWAFWAKVSSTTTAVILAKSDNNGSKGWVIYDNNGDTNLRVVYSGTNLTATVNNLYVTNAWTHIVITWDGTVNGSGVSFYANGAFKGVGSGTGSGSHGDDTAQHFYFSRADYSALNSPVAGLLDDVRVYGRALSGGQVQALYQQSRLGHPDTLRWLGKRTWFVPTAAAPPSSWQFNPGTVAANRFLSLGRV